MGAKTSEQGPFPESVKLQAPTQVGEHLPGDLMLVGAPRLPPAFPVRGVWQGAGQEMKYLETGGGGGGGGGGDVQVSTGNSLDVQVVLKDYTQTCTIVALEGEGQLFCTSRQN